MSRRPRLECPAEPIQRESTAVVDLVPRRSDRKAEVMKTFPRKSNSRKFGLIGAVAVSAVAVSLFAKSGSDVQDAANTTVRDHLTRVSESLNANLPAMLDQNTRLESTSAAADRVFEYQLTIVGMERMPRRYEIVDEARPKIVKSYRTAADMQEMREMEVTVRYVYSDASGEEIVRFEVGPDDL